VFSFFLPEVFDPLGTTQQEVIERLGNKKYFYFNSSPVQPEDSVDCGVYCIYWLCVRLYNSDKKYSQVLYQKQEFSFFFKQVTFQVLNSYFTSSQEKNQAIIEEFAKTGHFFEESWPQLDRTNLT